MCTALEPNRRIAWQTTSAPFPFQVNVDFVPVESGTQIDSIWRWEPRGASRLIAPLLDRMFKRVMEQDVANLARVMEAGEL